jgi:hypothetical protein
MCPGVDSASENEYPGGKGGRCVRLTTYHLQAPTSRNLGALTSWNPVGIFRPVTGHVFFYKTLHVSVIFSAHHQEFSTVHSALVSFMQFFDDRFQAESGWTCSSILTLLGSGHQKPA